jgi:hypothetical protein
VPSGLVLPFADGLWCIESERDRHEKADILHEAFSWGTLWVKVQIAASARKRARLRISQMRTLEEADLSTLNRCVRPAGKHSVDQSCARKVATLHAQ